MMAKSGMMLQARYAVLALCFLGVLFVQSAPCPAQDTITWAYMNAPPAFYQQDGRMAGALADVVYMLEAGMPEYGHEEVLMPFARILADLKQGKHVCLQGMLKNAEREKYMAFSLPTRLVEPVVVAARADDPRFGDKDVVSLGKLATEDLRLGVPKGMSNGAVIDAIVFTMGRDKVMFIHDEDVTGAALKLLKAGRIDFALLDLFEAAWAARQMGLADDVSVYAIREEEAWLPAYVACPNTDWGRQVIERVDQVLRAGLSMDGFKAYEPYIPSDALKEKARRKYKKLILDKVMQAP